MSAPSTPIVTNEKIRQFIMDKPELNTLVDGVRFPDKLIDDTAIMVVDYYNSVPPPLSDMYTIENFPYAYVLLMGTVGMLLRGAAVGEASNNLSYSAAGVQVNDRDKAQIFTSAGTEMWNEAKQMIKDIKIGRNIAGAYGTKFSEYIYRVR